ncbi:DUF3828 domain-containing protein [Paraburkholderia humisilvae]|uniref:DUF3828 domain-containing protein n=1 Tax=Paraburkholderia humisilvae TaxID=627669 RepID=UPI0024834449|nr:DUF3828 domain-containing protein [Paraburkholderia humisilvae]
MGLAVRVDSDARHPLRDAAIENYVASGTLARLRKDYARSGPPEGTDYFLKVQDYDAQDWRAHVVTHPVMKLGDVAVVPVTFGSTDKVHVLVFMRLFGGTWKITKVSDTQDYR